MALFKCFYDSVHLPSKSWEWKTPNLKGSKINCISKTQTTDDTLVLRSQVSDILKLFYQDVRALKNGQ